MNLIVRWLLMSLALVLAIHVVPGLSFSGGPLWVLIAALALGLLNLLARPFIGLLRVLTWPISCLTFGLWSLLLSLFLNILAFYFVGSLEWGFKTDSFGAAALGALVMSVLNVVLTGLFELSTHRPDR